MISKTKPKIAIGTLIGDVIVDAIGQQWCTTEVNNEFEGHVPGLYLWYRKSSRSTWEQVLHLPDATGKLTEVDKMLLITAKNHKINKEYGFRLIEYVYEEETETN
jgi:hypothetical protein